MGECVALILAKISLDTLVSLVQEAWTGPNFASQQPFHHLLQGAFLGCNMSQDAQVKGDARERDGQKGQHRMASMAWAPCPP